MVETRTYDYGLCYSFDASQLTILKPNGMTSGIGPRYGNTSIHLLLKGCDS